MAYELTFSQAGAVAINTDLLPSIDAKKRQGFQLALTSLGTSGVYRVVFEEFQPKGARLY